MTPAGNHYLASDPPVPSAYQRGYAAGLEAAAKVADGYYLGHDQAADHIATAILRLPIPDEPAPDVTDMEEE